MKRTKNKVATVFASVVATTAATGAVEAKTSPADVHGTVVGQQLGDASKAALDNIAKRGVVREARRKPFARESGPSWVQR